MEIGATSVPYESLAFSSLPYNVYLIMSTLSHTDYYIKTDGTPLSDTAHYYMECSNKGLCDRTVATCACFIGYEGNACQRATCPNLCSGHGVCKTNRELADGDHGNIYELWDADLVRKTRSGVC